MFTKAITKKPCKALIDGISTAQFVEPGEKPDYELAAKQHDKYVETLEKYIDMFESAGARLFFSCSIDGPIIESDNRPFNDESKNYIKKDDVYYKKIIDFCNKRNFGYHPMVNANSIEKWPE